MLTGWNELIQLQQHSSRPQGPSPPLDLALVPYAYLTHFDLGSKLPCQVSHEVPEVDAIFSGKVEQRLVAAVQVLGADQLHRETTSLYALAAVLIRLALPGSVALGDFGVLGAGHANDAREVLGAPSGAPTAWQRFQRSDHGRSRR